MRDNLALVMIAGYTAVFFVGGYVYKLIRDRKNQSEQVRGSNPSEKPDAQQGRERPPLIRAAR